MTNLKSFRSMAGLTALACLATINILAESSVPSRVTKRVDESRLTTLKGHMLPIVNSTNDRGPAADNLNLDHLQLVLQRSDEQEKELHQLMDEQNDKNSPNFHKWLTAEEFGKRFGVSQEDIDQVTGWLESHGFHVDRVYPNRMMIDFSGTAGNLKEGFHTAIHNFELKGEMHLANNAEPQIPTALAPVIKGIASLNDIKPKAMHESVGKYTFTTSNGTFHAVTPQDTQAIYGLNPLYTAGITGQGQTIYLVEDTDSYGGANYTGDWQTYVNTFGLSSYGGSLAMVHPGAGCTDPGTNSADSEADLDVEVASSVAPSAALKLISCADSTFTFGGQVALQGLINETSPTVGVVSVSYGLCEALTGQAGNALFYSTYQQAAAEGFSVFVSSGDEGPSSCSNLFSVGSEYDVASLGVTGWGETPYNVSVGGTDFEDTYNSIEPNAAEGGSAIPVSNYWNATNSTYYGSAKSYIPEIPWNDACASVLLSEVLTGSFTPYGASPATCNNSSYDTTSTYLSTGAASGGASNCAIGAAGSSQSSYDLSASECQGYPKPSWQTAYGVPSDGVRDIPDVSMFAANGVWGHYEVVCWSDPAYTADGSVACTGAPSGWSGFGGTSVAAPTMAAVQALVNQKTGTVWGNVAPTYYQIGRSEYGTQGGTFAGSACNASGAGGPGSACVFNDVTQGDIDLACKDNGTLEEAHCYLPAGTYGVDSTDNVTAATVINGGSGYTTAPACTIAGPTNANPYKSPTGSILFAGGTQATCTATVNAGTTTAVYAVEFLSAAAGEPVTVGGTTYTLTGSTASAEATALAASINATGTYTAVTTTVTSGTGRKQVTYYVVTITSKTAGYAGNFNVTWGPGFFEGPNYVSITNTTAGQGPNYVSGITITTAGSGYQPETPITLTGVGSGAVAVANTSIGTAPTTYQPTYGAAPGYDLATGLGSPNAKNLVNSSVWYIPGTTIITAVPKSTLSNGSVYTMTVALANSGTGTAQNVTLTSATLGGVATTSTLTPIPYINPGSSATVTLTFPLSADPSGGKATATFAGTYTGGSGVFSGSAKVTPILPAFVAR